MTFKKGDKKPENSGRKKGTKNKTNLGISEILQKNSIDCVEELISIAQNTSKEEIKFGIYKELLKYVYPQLKAVEVNEKISKGINIIVADEKHKDMLENL